MNRPISWIGGKSKIANQIISAIPDHKTFCEVFTGGGVIFHKNPSKIEIINDLDENLINFFRCLKYHSRAVIDELAGLVVSKNLFDDFQRQLEAGGLTDIQRAARFFYRQKLAYGGKVKHKAFGRSTQRPPRLRIKNIPESLDQFAKRLANVVIDNLPYQKFITQYDNPETFMYLDPPYYKLPYYKHNLVYNDYIEMAEILSKVNSKFLLSLNKHNDIEEIFKEFRIKEISIDYSVYQPNGKRKKAVELLISNYDVYLQQSIIWS